MKRYATYRRVSEITATNIEGSMNDQRDRCQTHIRQADGIFVRDYEEAGKSAYNEKNLDKRSAYQQMLKDAKAGMFDVVLVYKYDRFSRRTRIALQARYELEQAGVSVESVSEPFDTTTAAGRFGVRQMLSVAELFSDMLSERLTMARASEAARGRHVGPVPVGYIKMDGKGQIARSAPYDALVIQACTLFAPGQLSPGRVAGSLNDAGYTMPNGRPLIAQDIRRIAQNAQLYAGYVRSAGIWIKGNHTPIIDEELCQRVLAAYARRSVKQDRRYVRTQDTTALLAGLVYCDMCRQDGREAKMHYNADARKTPPYRRFRCKTNADGGPCTAGAAPADFIEPQVLDMLGALALALEGNWLEEALEIAEAQISAPAPKIAPVDPARIQEKIRRLGDLYMDGVKTAEAYQAELAALRAQLASAPVQLPTRPQVTLQEVAERLQQIPALLSAATIGERRAVLHECIDQVYAEYKHVRAIRPTALFEPLLLLARDRVMDGEYRSTASNSVNLDIPLILPARSEVRS